LHAQNAIMHAVENKMPVLRVSNTGWTCSINGVGQVVSKKDTRFDQESFFVYKIIPKAAKSFYSKIGDVFCLLCLCFVIISVVWAFLYGRRNET